MSNNDGIGDNRNILKMLDLQQSDVNGQNSGSFQDIFNKTVTEVGSTVRSSQMEAQDAESEVETRPKLLRTKKLEFHLMKKQHL